MIRSPKVTALLAGVAFAAIISPAYALDGQDLLKKINAAYGAGSGEIAAQSVDIDGDDVTLTGVTFTPAGEDPKAVELGDITLQDVSEEDGGAYHIGLVEFPDIDFQQDNTGVKVSELYVSGIWIPGDVTGDGIDSLLMYEEAHSGPVSITVDGKEVFALEEASGTAEISDDESTLSFAGEVTGIKADLSSVEDPRSRLAMEALGLQSLDGKITMSGNWEIASGTIDVEEYAFQFDKIGTLDLSFSLSGYTMQLIKQLQQTASKMQEQPDDAQARDAASLAMLGLAQQLNFIGAEIRFDDDGVTKNGLEFAGKQYGASAENVAEMVKGTVPVMLGRYKLTSLMDTVPAAINAYLDNPQNLTISLKPASPVALPIIVGAAMGEPETLPTVLGVTVTAND